MRGLIGKTIENGFDFSAVPSGKGKLEKMSIWTSSNEPRHCGTSKIVFQTIFSNLPCLLATADSLPCDIRRKPVHHGSLVMM
jgi:hypothetical protein